MNSTQMVINLLKSNQNLVANYFHYCRTSGVLPSCSGFERYTRMRLEDTYKNFSRKEVTDFLRSLLLKYEVVAYEDNRIFKRN